MFNKAKPIIVGVDVERGVLKTGTTLCINDKNMLRIGIVESIQKDKKKLTEARRKDGSVAIRIKTEAGI